MGWTSGEAIVDIGGEIEDSGRNHLGLKGREGRKERATTSAWMGGERVCPCIRVGERRQRSIRLGAAPKREPRRDHTKTSKGNGHRSIPKTRCPPCKNRRRISEPRGTIQPNQRTRRPRRNSNIHVVHAPFSLGHRSSHTMSSHHACTGTFHHICTRQRVIGISPVDSCPPSSKSLERRNRPCRGAKHCATPRTELSRL